ncbi:MAG: hypothetical protein JWN24_4879 [Phycisphaerales bacterium]|jgi:hypothetical protein|nr:hypothetical protein [Phycisphaerales bacterium]
MVLKQIRVLRMKRLYPSRVELAIFIGMALVCGLVVAVSGRQDTMLFLLGMPVFLIASLMGFRRSLLAKAVEKIDDSEPAA